MNILLRLHLLLTGICLFALLRPTYGQGKFSVSLSATPVFHSLNTHRVETYSIINGGQPVDVYIQAQGWGYTTGVMVRYELANRLSLSTGLWLSRIDYPVPTIRTNPDLSANPNEAQITGIATRQRLYQIPVLLNYRSSAKRLSPYFSLGGSLNLPVVTIFDNGGEGKAPNQPVRFFPLVGAGASYRISTPLSLIIQPTFTYVPPRSDYVSYRNYQIGALTQLLYTF